MNGFSRQKTNSASAAVYRKKAFFALAVFSAALFLLSGCGAPSENKALPTPSAAPSPIPEPETVILGAASPSPSPTPAPKRTPFPTPVFVLNHSDTEIYGGGIKQLSAFYRPDLVNDTLDVMWRSADESVAIVDEYGVVIGIAPGDTYIVATSNKTGDRIRSNVTVTSARPQGRAIPPVEGNCYRRRQRVSRREVSQINLLIEELRKSHAVGAKIALSGIGYLGTPYGTAEGNIDCSMLVVYSCLDRNIRVPRRSDWQAWALQDRKIDKDAVQPGDFLFFAYAEGDKCTCRLGPPCQRKLGIHHAAIYLGEINGKRYVVEASSDIGRVVIRAWDGTENHAGMKLVMCARIW